MKKWQEWTIVALVGLIILAAVGMAYWYLTEDRTVPTTVAVQSAEEKDLASAEQDLGGIKDLDLSALNQIDSEIQAIDLSNL